MDLVPRIIEKAKLDGARGVPLVPDWPGSLVIQAEEQLEGICWFGN